MELLLALAIGLLTGCSVYLILRARSFPVVLGLVMLSYATNLFLFVSGRLHTDMPPLLLPGTSAAHTDPLPQALVLTAIVISFAMTAFVVVLVLRTRGELGTDRVDSSGRKGDAE